MGPRSAAFGRSRRPPPHAAPGDRPDLVSVGFGPGRRPPPHAAPGARSVGHLAGCLAALLLAAPAVAETLTVIAPQGQGPDADSLAAELGVGVDLALRIHARYRRLGESAALPGEVMAVFGCLRLDAECATNAGEAAGADLVLLAEVSRESAEIRVELRLLDVRRRTTRQALTRALVVQPPAPEPEAAVEGALHDLPSQLLAGDATASGVVVTASPPATVRLDDRPVVLGRLSLAAPGRHRLTLRGPDGVTRALELNLVAEEIRLVDGDRVPHVASTGARSPSLVGAWMTAGLGAAALLGAGYMAIQVQREQSDYDRAVDAAALTEHRERGEKYALAGNVLLGASALALGVSVWLFLDDP